MMQWRYANEMHRMYSISNIIHIMLERYGMKKGSLICITGERHVLQ